MISLTQEASLISLPELDRKTSELYKFVREISMGEIKFSEQKSKQSFGESPRNIMSSPSSKLDFLLVSKPELKRKSSETGEDFGENAQDTKMITNLARIPKSREFFNVNFFERGGFVLPQIISIFKENFGVHFDQSKANEFFEKLKQVSLSKENYFLSLDLNKKKT
jgi:hypothetical protein